MTQPNKRKGPDMALRIETDPIAGLAELQAALTVGLLTGVTSA